MEITSTIDVFKLGIAKKRMCLLANQMVIKIIRILEKKENQKHELQSMKIIKTWHE